MAEMAAEKPKTKGFHPIVDFREDWHSRKREKYPRAFPGDTYVADLHDAADSGKPWMKFFPFVIVLSVFADIGLLVDTFCTVFDKSFPPSGLTDIFVTVLAPIAFIAVYVSFGYSAGKKRQEWKAFGDPSSHFTSTLLLLVEFAVVGFLGLVRWFGEVYKSGGGSGASTVTLGFANSGSSGFGFGLGTSTASTNGFLSFWDSAMDAGFDAAMPAIALVVITMLGAAMSYYYSYGTYDAFAGEKTRIAESHMAEDTQLYERVYFEHAASIEKSRDYEARERELDREVVESVYKIRSLATKLNGIVDPADAHEFARVSAVVNKEMRG